MRLKPLKVEKEKEKALRLIMENLENFEELADKLRNPLAVIKGYLEVREEVPESEFIRNISEHAAKIEKILDELRIKELQTYEMKKALETTKWLSFAIQGKLSVIKFT
jgi:tRNA nucleotidyltransferase (CCA-adding enzyme)